MLLSLCLRHVRRNICTTTYRSAAAVGAGAEGHLLKAGAFKMRGVHVAD